MAFPSNVTTVNITGRLLASTVDGPLTGEAKAAVPAGLMVEFAPELVKITAPGALPSPTTFYQGGLPDPVRGVLDSDGYLCTPDPDNEWVPQFRGVRLIATDDDAFSVKDWTWRVKVKTRDGRVLESYGIAVPKAAATNGLDLTNLAPVPSTPGYGIPQAEAAAAAAAQNAQIAGESAITAAEKAAAAADSAESAGEVTVVTGAVVGNDLILGRGNGATFNAGNVRGPKGDEGDPGADGSNVLPTDAAIAQALVTDGSNTQSAADERYASRQETARVAGLTDAAVNIYVDTALGADTNGGSIDAPFKTIQAAFDSIPKVINRDHYINVMEGDYDEDVKLVGVSGAAIVVQKSGEEPVQGQPTGVNVRCLAFYDIQGRVLLQHVTPFNAESVTARAQLLFSRVSYATVNSNYLAANTKALAIPTIEFDGSAGSVGSNHFDNQKLMITSRNGSRVRIDTSNTHGPNASNQATRAEAAEIFHSGPPVWIPAATKARESLYGGSYNQGWSEWSPAYSATGGMTYSEVATSFARYCIEGNTCHYQLRCAGTTAGTGSTSLQFTLPVAAYLNQNAAFGNVVVSDGGFSEGWLILANNTTVQVRLPGKNTAWSIGVDRRIYAQGSYEIAG